jgi:hypothetical protein
MNPLGQRGRCAWEIREAEKRIEMLDASIHAHLVAGEHDAVARLLRVRHLAARQAALLDFHAMRTPSVAHTSERPGERAPA